MTFLPDDYDVPTKGGRYAKMKPGENRYRILGSPLMGNEGWLTEKGGKRKPIRKPMKAAWAMDEVDEPERIKHFWALPVWSYADNMVMILHLTQVGILKALRGLSRDDDWGDPCDYDIAIIRTGEGMDTEYAVTPKPKRDLTPEQQTAWAETLAAGFDLSRLFDGGDPFTASPVTTGITMPTDDDPDSIPF